MGADVGSVQSVLGMLDRQLWIVTASDGRRHGGLLATWVTQVTLHADPLVMAVSLGANHFTRNLVDASQAMGLHLIAKRHSDLALRFATLSGRSADKLAGTGWKPGTTGAPLISDVVAWLDCRVIARLDGGDRVYYWAEVVDGGPSSSEKPLTDGEWMASLDAADRAKLAADREQDCRIQKPLFENWRRELPAIMRPSPTGGSSA